MFYRLNYVKLLKRPVLYFSSLKYLLARAVLIAEEQNALTWESIFASFAARQAQLNALPVRKFSLHLSSLILAPDSCINESHAS